MVKEQQEQVIQEIERVNGLVRERNKLNQLVFSPVSNLSILEL
jgi:F0F1-type ATP synthase delta subunit